MKRISFIVAAIGIAGLADAGEDIRQFVDMPKEARTEFRLEMLDFQSALNNILVALGDNNFSDAANAAENTIGISAMGRHRQSPINARPGMYMPDSMHAIARNMHLAATDFARTAKSGDLKASLKALHSVTSACVACHRSYRAQ